MPENNSCPERTETSENDGSQLKLLFFVDTGFPTFRADVAALFGVFLPRRSVLSDLVATTTPTDQTWPAGQFFNLYKKPSKRRFPGKGTLGELFDSLREYRFLRGLQPGSYDALQVRNKVRASVYAIWAARSLGVPFFYWMSFPMADIAIRTAQDKTQPISRKARLFLSLKGHLGRLLLYRYVLPRATHVFVQSDKMRSDLAAAGIPFSHMTPVPMGIDPDRFRPDIAPSDDPRLTGRRVITYLGTCERVRKVDFLFEVAAILSHDFPDVTLLVVGDAATPEDKDWLRQRVVETKTSENVVITGWIPQDQALSYVSRADVALALMAPDPLLDSTSPTKLVEYLAMSKAVVANDHPDQRKVLEESGAGICCRFDVQEFAAAVATLLSDDVARRAMAARGRPYVLEHRSYEVISKSVADVYASFRCSRQSKSV